MPAKFPRFRGGEQFGLRGRNGELILDAKAANFLNAAAVEMQRLGKVSATPPMRWSEGADGRRVVCDFAPEIWAKLSGAGPQYSFVQQQYNPGTNTWSNMDGGRTGGECYESKGKTGLSGKVVRITYAPSAGDWRFQWVGYGTTPCTLKFRLSRPTVCPAVGATVDFILGGVTVFSGVTDVNGECDFGAAVAGGVYTINWSYYADSGTTNFTGCGLASATAALPSGFSLNCTDAGQPPTLYVTDVLGTRQCFPPPPPAGLRSVLGSLGGCTGPVWNLTTFFGAPASSGNFSRSCVTLDGYSGSYASGPLAGGAFLIHV